MAEERSAVEEVHRNQLALTEDALTLKHDILMRKLSNWKVGASLAFLSGLALGMTVVGMIYTNAAQ
jgi:hypothetical protein